MTTFIESPRFPTDISRGSRGGPAYNTTVIVVDSGAESRNQRWSYPRHEYDVAYGVNTLAKLESLLQYFHVVAGRAIGFRFKDWMDYKSGNRAATVTNADAAIGTGDGAEDDFQLVKKYTQGSYTRTRKILKPVSGSVLVAVAATAKTEGVHYDVNYATGIVTFKAGNIPTAGQAVTAGFEFDVPVRFDTDRLSINFDEYVAASAQVPLVELKYGDT